MVIVGRSFIPSLLLVSELNLCIFVWCLNASLSTSFSYSSQCHKRSLRDIKGCYTQLSYFDGREPPLRVRTILPHCVDTSFSRRFGNRPRHECTHPKTCQVVHKFCWSPFFFWRGVRVAGARRHGCIFALIVHVVEHPPRF